MKTSAKYFGLAVGPRSGNMSQMTPKLIHLWCQSQKISTSEPKNLFRVQSTRLADPFEPLNSALAQLAEVKQLKTAFFRPKLNYEYIVRWFSKCL